MTITHQFVLAIVIILLVVALAVGSVILEAWLDFYKAPKVPMFWCTKHGYFRKEHCLPLFPEMGGTADNSWICPSCYREAVFINPDKKMKVN